MIRSVIPAIFALAACPVAPAAGIAPLTISFSWEDYFFLDRDFTHPSYTTSVDDVSHTEPDGTAIRSVTAHADYSIHTTNAAGFRIGSGDIDFAASFQQRGDSSASGYVFRSTYSYSNRYEYSENLSFSGNFLFVATGDSENTLSAARSAYVLVDREISCQLTLTGMFDNGDLLEAFNSVMLFGAPYDFTGLLEIVSSSDFPTTPPDTAFERMWSTSLTNASISGIYTGSDLEVEILLSPRDPLNPETLLIQWFLDPVSDIGYVTTRSTSGVLTDAGFVTEEFTITAVPEPSIPLHALVLTGLASLRRKRSGTNRDHRRI